MIDPEIPSFLDFEASSLSPNSYPIEVAWSGRDGSIEGHLISPAGIDHWVDWDSEAEKVHGIPRETLYQTGEPPPSICKRMNEQLGGMQVFCDSPRFDGMWLSSLFAASGTKPSFELRHVDHLLVEMICPQIAGRTSGLMKIDALKEEARRLMPRQHRAAWDVEYLVQLWRLAAYEARRG